MLEDEELMNEEVNNPLSWHREYKNLNSPWSQIKAVFLMRVIAFKSHYYNWIVMAITFALEITTMVYFYEKPNGKEFYIRSPYVGISQCLFVVYWMLLLSKEVINDEINKIYLILRA